MKEYIKFVVGKKNKNKNKRKREEEVEKRVNKVFKGIRARELFKKKKEKKELENIVISNVGKS